MSKFVLRHTNWKKKNIGVVVKVASSLMILVSALILWSDVLNQMVTYRLNVSFVSFIHQNKQHLIVLKMNIKKI